jgi:hypothetical protein
MKHRIHQNLKFWTDYEYQQIKRDYPLHRKRQVVTWILREFEYQNCAMRYRDADGKVAWKATPQFLEEMSAEEDSMELELDW